MLALDVHGDIVVHSWGNVTTATLQGYLFCSFAELNNSAKNSKNYEKWKETTKFTRDLLRF